MVGRGVRRVWCPRCDGDEVPSEEERTGLAQAGKKPDDMLEAPVLMMRAEMYPGMDRRRMAGDLATGRRLDLACAGTMQKPAGQGKGPDRAV